MKMKPLEDSPKRRPKVVSIKPSKAFILSKQIRSNYHCCCCCNDSRFRTMKSPIQEVKANRKLLPTSCSTRAATTLKAGVVSVLIVLQLSACNQMSISGRPQALSMAEAAESSLVGAQDVASADVEVVSASSDGGAREGTYRAGNTHASTEINDDGGDSEGDADGEDGRRGGQSTETGGDGRPHSGRHPSAGLLKNKMKTLDEFLESLPTLSVGQKHTARFECELNKDAAAASDSSSKAAPTQLVWVKLTRRAEWLADGASHAGNRLSTAAAIQEQQEHDTKVISLNQKLITPDKRFKVRRQSPVKWILSIDNVGPDDNHAYYLCQSAQQANAAGNRRTLKHQQSAADDSPGRKFVGGARLNVLVPPKIIEQETSPSLVQANEFEQLSLKCKVNSEPQSQLMWKREDGRSLDGLEQRFRHQFERRPSQILSIDSSELVFNSVARQNAGAYLCIASNGVQPGVSQRMSVRVLKCRAGPEPSASPEPCEDLEEPSRSAVEIEPTTTATTSFARTKSWKTTKQTGSELQRRQQQQQQQQQRLLLADKRRANGRGNDRNSINRNGLDGQQQAGKSELGKNSSAAIPMLRPPFCSYLCALVTALVVACSLVTSP